MAESSFQLPVEWNEDLLVNIGDNDFGDATTATTSTSQPDLDLQHALNLKLKTN